MSRVTLPAFTALLVLLCASPAMAVDSGFYLGGSVGGATTEVSDAEFSFDENDFAWKIYGGYHFLQFFAVEAAYRNLGSPSADIFGSKLEIEPTGFDVAALVGVPLGPVYLFGKISAIRWDADAKFEGESDSEDGTDVGAGVGLSLDVARIRLRGEIEYFDIEDGVLMYSVGGAWLF